MPPTPLWFPATYEESRAHFRSYLELIQRRWPGARLGQHRLAGEEDLTIDWLEAPALERSDRLLLITTGEHGIEAYVGAAMLQLCLDTFLDRLAPQTTALLFVHALNPWGMKHRRRVNRDNIDLNRTFIWSEGAAGAPAHDPAFNPGYARLTGLLNPEGALPGYGPARQAFLAQTLRTAARVGLRPLLTSSALGQYAFPRGIYYGGAEMPEETRVLMGLYRQGFQSAARVAQLDMHTGYGPRYQMSVVTSEFETHASAVLRRQLNYPLVVKAAAAEFYPLRGDMIDYIYTLQRREFPERRLFAATLEFGTQGASFWNHYRDLRTVVFENRVHWHGAADPQTQAAVARDFEALFFPRGARWQAKAAADARQAIEGILRVQGFWRKAL